mgnify:CR=1 FL=1
MKNEEIKKFYGNQISFEWLKINYDIYGKPYNSKRYGIFYGLSKNKKYYRIRPLSGLHGYNTEVVKIPIEAINILGRYKRKGENNNEKQRF